MRRIPSVAVAALLAIGPLSGQALSRPVSRNPFPWMGDSSTSGFTGEVAVLVARGDQLTATLHYGAGQRAYRRAVEIAKSQGQIPTVERWRLAAALYFDGQNIEAARALDGLVSEAQDGGDLVAEGRALYGAAWLWGQGGHPVEARARVSRLKKLMESPYFPSDVRTDLSARIAMTENLTTR
ncbi:MAG TPA: hypothetical protein VFK78_01010 [Gemmatimonadales bacterium]|nr:hypothetical protein [Gemmatimonadales bacterium]